MKDLSKKQAAALDCIKTFIQQKGYSPTTRELAEALGYQSSSTVHSLLDKLAIKGYISKESSGSRTIRILKDTSPPAETCNGTVKFNLSYYGVDENLEYDATGLTKEEVERELVQWVLEQVDHWIEE